MLAWMFHHRSTCMSPWMFPHRNTPPVLCSSHPSSWEVNDLVPLVSGTCDKDSHLGGHTRLFYMQFHLTLCEAFWNKPPLIFVAPWPPLLKSNISSKTKSQRKEEKKCNCRKTDSKNDQMENLEKGPKVGKLGINRNPFLCKSTKGRWI